MSIYSQDNEWVCHKHGVFSNLIPEVHGFAQGIPGVIQNFVFPDCPKCLAVKEKGLCVDCESHAGTVNFSDSTMSYIHGMARKICRCCYRKIVEKAYLDAKENFEKLSTQLALEPCWPVEKK
jgi:hypothetical protein